MPLLIPLDNDVSCPKYMLDNIQDPIKLMNLTKKFGTFKAVDKLNLSIKANEVFCLLGHNGAGKTTVINMITGMFKPSSGNAIIYGTNLVEDIDSVR